MTVAALPRSRLHLDFLLANDAAPDFVLFRDAALASAIAQAYPGKGRYLGRETLPDFSPVRMLAARKTNRAYYRHVGEMLADLDIDHFIIFLEGEPLERFICDLPMIRSIELWEEGLSHYVDLTSDRWYAARGILQALCGFHSHAIMRRRMDRSRALVRDRFEQRNLRLPLPIATEFRSEFLLLGSPLVEDRLITKRAFLSALRQVACASPWPVRYLAHPREDGARAREDALGAGIAFDDNRSGLAIHAQRYGYRAYGAAVSTGLLDLGQYDRSFFLAGLFGLKRMHAVLAAWPHNPLAVVGDSATLERHLRDIPV
ncbi:hypothetical protein [Novosphingobium album (ex Liu et al. 2023)]|uniref:Uncharacterized protein n=1 Tax=Novosphingobium album (ex Liu et al. 2023) TaxID=3031130 RepID=A0ABT5WTH7_9SPHN|nr:hypothetical protein [Novosphingobium album (ex Liu et al. 2023)]MDE8653189.1 hypothetical protein [Novosphingobium album (ex Liu et al. 2023)]